MTTPGRRRHVEPVEGGEHVALGAAVHRVVAHVPDADARVLQDLREERAVVARQRNVLHLAGLDQRHRRVVDALGRLAVVPAEQEHVRVVHPQLAQRLVHRAREPKPEARVALHAHHQLLAPGLGRCCAPLRPWRRCGASPSRSSSRRARRLLRGRRRARRSPKPLPIDPPRGQSGLE